LPDIPFELEFKDLVSSMIDPNPDERPTSTEILLHPWFTIDIATTEEVQ